METQRREPFPRISRKISQKTWHVYYKMKDEAAFHELKRVEREHFMVNRPPPTNKA